MTVQSIPPGYHSVTPYLNINGAHEAIEFYKKAFSAKEIMRLTMTDGSVAHAEIEIGNSKIMLAEARAEWGNNSPQDLGGSPMCLCIYVEDVDAVFAQALAAGATITGDMAVKDQFYGDRAGSVTDPFGHKWTIMTHVKDVSLAEMQEQLNAM